MLKYKLSVGKMLTSPRGEVKKGKPPVYTISCLYVSETLDTIEDVRQTADTLIALSPIYFGFTLVADPWFSKRLCTLNSSRESSFCSLAKGQDENFRECLMLEINNGPAFYGIITNDKTYREYVSVNNVYKSKLFVEYKSIIDLETLKHRYEAEARFTIVDNTDTLPCIICYTQQDTIYVDRKES
ncbi:MAG: hypothetical protein K0S76_172 [Herbinix sp.]|nr:hypothetical protein [Herbinix sp.]